MERLLLNSGQNIQLPRCLLELIGNSKLLRRLAITQESQDRDWDVTQQPQCIWQFAYRCACESLKSCHEIKRQSFLERIRSELDVDAQGRDSHRCLSREELRQFARHPLVTIGGHTVTHPQLSVLTSLDQRKELSQNLETLEGLTGKRPWAFAYPYGSQSDYTHVTVEQVRALGYQAAFSNSLLPVERMPSEYEVPRRLVRNWDVSSFRKRLNEWLL